MNTLKTFSAICVMATGMFATELHANEIDELVQSATAQQQHTLQQALQHDVRTALYSTLIELEAQRSAEQFAKDLHVAVVDVDHIVEAD